MSWAMASFVVLFLALALGFAWYERTHPPAKIVALVAALAALAAAGRVAFAPIPNVKPTTDIVLLAGFALGAAPGFTVGAVAALASNVIFGQGPWTPWQMLAWGLCGLVGALLGRLSHRQLGRWPLAAACGLCGLGFGVIMDFSTWTTYTGAHTLGEYLAISATSLPFNLAHAIGNVVFCLAFGPAFLRALLRYRDRFTVRWEPLAAAGAVVAALLVAGGALALAPTPAHAQTADVAVAPRAQTAGLAAAPRAHTARSAAANAALYVQRAQNTDGGFGTARGRASTPLYTAWATMGLAAAGLRPAAVRHGGASAATKAIADGRRVTALGDVERSLLAVRAAGGSTSALLARVRRAQASDGSFNRLVNLTAFGVLGLRAGGYGITASSVRAGGRWLAGQAGRDGGYSFAGPKGASDIDNTAAALQALVRSGYGGSRAARNAVEFLTRRQNPDGGFPLSTGGSNAQSTAWVVQALIAAGRSPALHRGGARSPLSYLVSLQAPDGSIRYSRTSAQTPVWVTAQALMALYGRPFPITAP